MKNHINITALNIEEALRYMGFKGQTLDDDLKAVISECEKRLLEVIRPKYVYKVFDISQLTLPGKDINKHLEQCEKVVFLCATISAEADRLVRTAEINDITSALVLDTLASVAVEEVCNQAETAISGEMPDYYMTWRYGIGYGDTPLEYQKEFLKLTDASKSIGVCMTPECILTPRKSVTCVIGLSKEPIERKRRGCSICNMKDSCPYRKRGERCEF